MVKNDGGGDDGGGARVGERRRIVGEEGRGGERGGFGNVEVECRVEVVVAVEGGRRCGATGHATGYADMAGAGVGVGSSLCCCWRIVGVVGDVGAEVKVEEVGDRNAVVGLVRGGDLF